MAGKALATPSAFPEEQWQMTATGLQKAAVGAEGIGDPVPHRQTSSREKQNWMALFLSSYCLYPLTPQAKDPWKTGNIPSCFYNVWHCVTVNLGPGQWNLHCVTVNLGPEKCWQLGKHPPSISFNQGPVLRTHTQLELGAGPDAKARHTPARKNQSHW